MSKSTAALCIIIPMLGGASANAYAQGCSPALTIMNRTPFEVDNIFAKIAGTKIYGLDALGPTAVISPAQDYSLDFDHPTAQHYDVSFSLNARTLRPINVTFDNENLCNFHNLDLIFDKSGFDLEVHD